MKRVNILFKLEMNFSYHAYFLPAVDALGFWEEPTAISSSPENTIVGPQVTGDPGLHSAPILCIQASGSLGSTVTLGDPLSVAVGADVSVPCFCVSPAPPQILTINELQALKKWREAL